MTHNEVMTQNKIIPINVLNGLEDISDSYYLIRYHVINATTNSIVAVTIEDTRKYPYVTLTKKNNSKQIKVPIHKIIGLAYISNVPHHQIRHVTTDFQDYRIDNLYMVLGNTPETHKIATGEEELVVRIVDASRGSRALVQVTMTDGTTAMGTIPEAARKLGIPDCLVRRRYYLGKPRSRKGGYHVYSVELLTGAQTIEKIPGA